MSTVKNYSQALAYLKGKKERPFAHNTRLELCAEGIEAKYHGNTVATFYPDGSNAYSSCGWKTHTTKERINWFLPDGFYVYQERSIWYISKGNHWTDPTGSNWVFADGITIDADGAVYNAGQDNGEVKKTIKTIKKYVDGYIAALLNGEVGKPSGGDCWYCAMVTTEGENLGEAFKDTSHILSHFEESYYVPSMLMNAERFNHRFCGFAKDGIARLWEGMEVSEWQRDVIARDVRSSLTSYLKHVLNLAQ